MASTDITLPAAAAPLRVTQATAVEQARAVAEVAAAVQVAQMNPRDIRRAWADMDAACARTGLAERAFYDVRNRGRGPTVHLARELARIWGNMDYGVHELSRDDARGMSEIRAYAWDQQTNVRSSRTFQVPHRRMGGGAVLTDLTDIYLNNQNIGARAVRECILSALPADFVEDAKTRCRKTIERGDGKPLPDRINGMVTRFAELGVKAAQIERRLGRPRGQWTAVDIADLAVVFRTIERHETTIDEEFPTPPVSADALPGQRYVPDPDAAAKAAAFPGFVAADMLVVPAPDDEPPAEDWPPVAGPDGPQ